MTENEAINELQANIDLPFGFTVSDEVSEIAIQALEEIKQYREIGTVEEFKALKEKATPKKGSNDGARCRSCGTYNNFITDNLFNPKGHPVVYCWNCGQAIEWEMKGGVTDERTGSD